MREYFYDLAAFLDTQLQRNEQYTCWFAGEASDFVRFNHSAIRQAGHVRQLYFTLHLIDGLRHAKITATFGGTLDADRPLLLRMLQDLRARLPDLPDDPHLLVSTEVKSSEHAPPSRLPPTTAMVDEVLTAGQGHDLVGMLAVGPICHGFANSLGQRNWHESASFNLDWSLYGNGDKAVKSGYAGFEWDTAAFREKFSQALAQFSMLQRAPVSVPPGAYRAYLAPAALNEIVGMLNWNGLSEKALRTKQSCVGRMRDEDVRLHPSVNIMEHAAAGLAPSFQGEGFLKPERSVLIEEGRLSGSMISPRTAKEYGLVTNGAGDGEAAHSLDMTGGDVPMSEVLKQLDTGVYVANLWYLNFSDRINCRLTGMTRFATFWVENGEIKAPLNVMRFDDSLYRIFGNKLIGLTQERELVIDSASYGARSTDSTRLPGALVSDFTFVL
jgi:predicted Zn-dependent protease